MNIADENLIDYSFLSKYHFPKSKNYSKRRFRISHWILMFIGTPCISLLNSNYRRRVPKVLRLLWVMVIFRFVVHLLNVICFKLWSLYIWYNVDTVLYQFLETGTSDNTQIGQDQLPKWWGFNLHHLSFYLNSPFK